MSQCGKPSILTKLKHFLILGAYGTVFRARDKTNEQIVALKKMRFSLTEDGVPMAILREISLLKQLEKFDHPNIVRYMSFLARQIDRFNRREA